tara:strand:- start:754 stop:1983 length:1230 start_codon:yes stop_codon:yes gene_type:complete
MSLIINKIKNADIYILPLAIFFVLISSAATNLFVLLAVILSVVHCVHKRNYLILFEKNIFKICFLIYLLLLISASYSFGSFEEIIGSLKKYIKFLYIPFIYYLIKIHKSEKLIINFFILGSTIVLFLSYMKFYNIFDFSYVYDFLRNNNISSPKEKIVSDMTSVFQNYIIQGIVLSFYSFLCLYKAKEENSYIYYLLSILSLFNVLFLNNSRAAYIIIILLLSLSFFIIIKNNKVRIFSVIIIFSLIFTQFGSNLENRVNNISQDINLIETKNYKSSLGLRYIWAKIGLNNILERPLIGSGVGSYKFTSVTYLSNSDINDKEYFVTDNPHNELVNMSTQLGVVGSIFFLLFLLFLLKESAHVLTLGASFLIIISSIFNSAFYDNMLGLFLVIIIGLLYQNKINVKNEVF